MRTFIAGATRIGLSVASSVGEAGRHLGQEVGGRRGDDHEVGLAGQTQMPHLALLGQREKVGVNALGAERGGGERRHEMSRALRHDDAHHCATLAQAADQIEAFIGGDAARDDQQNPPALERQAYLRKRCCPDDTGGAAVEASRAVFTIARWRSPSAPGR
jgi:hypothetical protein